MGEITICEKPEWVTFDDIHSLLYIAHASNREIGFNVKTAEMSGNELRDHLGSTGKCFVALDGDKLVGTKSYRIIDRDYWCAHGKVVDRVLEAVLPEYRGQHISTRLSEAIFADISSKGYQFIEVRTAEDNKIQQKACIKEGFRYLDFKAFSGLDHYTIVMMKWLPNYPYSERRINLYFTMRRFLVKLRYKKGKIKRFGI